MNREDWLTNCINDYLRPIFVDVSAPLPEQIRVSCSWPSKGGLSKKGRVYGQAWPAGNSGDGSFEIFITPLLSISIEVLAVLVHELVHCAVGLSEGHKGRFRAVALAVGLKGKMTATTAGTELTERLGEISEAIGPYPHATLTAKDPIPKQGTRMIKVECPTCGYTVRTTRKWIEVGVPTCPCGKEMEVEEQE